MPKQNNPPVELDELLAFADKVREFINGTPS